MSDVLGGLISIGIVIGATVWANKIAKRKGRGIGWGIATFLFVPTLLLLLLMPSIRRDAPVDELPDPIVAGHAPGTQITIERRQRNAFGKLVSFVFWFWQFLIVAWFASYLIEIGDQYGSAVGKYEQAGTVFGGSLGVTIIMWSWLIGSFITGMMMFFTRGEKVTITRIV